MNYLIDVLGMDPAHSQFVRYYSFLWLNGSGMGWHSDYTSKFDGNLFFLRLIFGAGGSRTIRFKSMAFVEGTKSSWETGEGMHVDDGELYSFESNNNADAYLTSPFANGKLPMCWCDYEKKEGIVVKHEVMRLDNNDTRSGNIIVDFPLASIKLVAKALATFRTTTFELDFN